MKRSILLTAVLTLSLSVFLCGQTASGQSGPVKAKKVTISGKITEDGKAIVTEGKTWVVSNVEKLRDHMGETVTVKALMDPLTSRIEVLSMKMTSAQASTSARLGDSAFRR